MSPGPGSGSVQHLRLSVSSLHTFQRSGSFFTVHSFCSLISCPEGILQIYSQVTEEVVLISFCIFETLKLEVRYEKLYRKTGDLYNDEPRTVVSVEMYLIL
jgi:hypothetical protein